jgi:hypothetical protein
MKNLKVLLLFLILGTASYANQPKVQISLGQMVNGSLLLGDSESIQGTFFSDDLDRRFWGASSMVIRVRLDMYSRSTSRELVNKQDSNSFIVKAYFLVGTKKYKVDLKYINKSHDSIYYVFNPIAYKNGSINFTTNHGDVDFVVSVGGLATGGQSYYVPIDWD